MVSKQRAERRWLIGGAEELAQGWLRESLKACTWQLEVLGLQNKGASVKNARIEIRCVFDREADAQTFADRFLGAEDPSSPAVPAPPPPENEGDAAFSAGAERILAGPEPISAGKVHFLDLEKVRAYFGDGWPKIAARAETLVRRAIERRLSPQDVYRKTTDLNFLVMFANLSGRDADTKCALMAEEIARMLVGDELGAGMMSVKTVATEVNGPETLNKVAASGDVTRRATRKARYRGPPNSWPRHFRRSRWLSSAIARPMPAWPA